MYVKKDQQRQDRQRHEQGTARMTRSRSRRRRRSRQSGRRYRSSTVRAKFASRLLALESRPDMNDHEKQRERDRLITTMHANETEQAFAKAERTWKLQLTELELLELDETKKVKRRAELYKGFLEEKKQLLHAELHEVTNLNTLSEGAKKQRMAQLNLKLRGVRHEEARVAAEEKERARVAAARRVEARGVAARVAAASVEARVAAEEVARRVAVGGAAARVEEAKVEEARAVAAKEELEEELTQLNSILRGVHVEIERASRAAAARVSLDPHSPTVSSESKTNAIPGKFSKRRRRIFRGTRSRRRSRGR